MLFPKYSELLERNGNTLACTDAMVVERDSRYVTYYTPFEHVVTTARLVLVGITPGITQLENSYAAMQSALRAGATPEEALRASKEAGAFSGDLRKNLLRLLKHFRFAERLDIPNEEHLWTSASSLLHSTSVVPHAAFARRNEKLAMFNGSFDQILAAPVLFRCFRDQLLPSLTKLPSNAFFVGLGPTPLDALHWCVREGLLRDTQVLGAFPHPSRNAGSQVDIYLGIRKAADLHPKDPVQFRVKWLSAAYQEMDTKGAASVSAAE